MPSSGSTQEPPEAPGACLRPASRSRSCTSRPTTSSTATGACPYRETRRSASDSGVRGEQARRGASRPGGRVVESGRAGVDGVRAVGSRAARVSGRDPAPGEDLRPYQVAARPVAFATFTIDAAEAIVDLWRAGAAGVVHVVNDGACSRLDLARAVVEEAGFAPTVVVDERNDPPGALKRPAYSSSIPLGWRRFLGRRFASLARRAALLPRDDRSEGADFRPFVTDPRVSSPRGRPEHAPGG